MTIARGVALPTGATFGHAETSDLGPTAGNGFSGSWPDDLAQLHEIGISDVRLTLDWARLQTRPDADLTDEWVECFEQIIRAADAIDLRVWASLYDGGVPRWFDNEGGIADAEAFTRWWPRWVERAADTFGDVVDGWVPFDAIPDGAAQPWRDTWGILGGSAPVVASVVGGFDDLDRIATYVGRMDRLGVVLDAGPAADDASGRDRRADDWGTLVRAAAVIGDEATVHLTVTADDAVDPDLFADAVDTAVTVAVDAADDGVDVEQLAVDPAIAAHDSRIGLLDPSRQPTAAATSFLTSLGGGERDDAG
jgi:beta-glucosidase